MAKMRVYELAKELEVKSADVVEALSKNGIEVKAASSIEDENIDYVRKVFSKSKTSEISGAEKKNTDKEESKKEKPAKDTLKKDTSKEEKSAEKSALDREKNEKNQSGDDDEGKDTKEEKAKPRVIITSKGVVRTGERHSHTEGEHRHHRHEDGKHHHTGEKHGKSTAHSENATKKTEHDTRVKKHVSKQEVDGGKAEIAPENVKKTPEKNLHPKDVDVIEKTVQKEETPKKETATKEEISKETGKKKEAEKETASAKVEPIPETSNAGGKSADENLGKEKGKSSGERGQHRATSNSGAGRDKASTADDHKRPGKARVSDAGERADRRNNPKDRGNGDRNQQGRSGHGKDGNFSREGGRNSRRGDTKANGAEPSGKSAGKDRRSRDSKMRQDSRRERGKNNNYEDGARGGKNGRGKSIAKPEMTRPKKKEVKKEDIKIISIPDTITVADLAEKMKMQPSAIIKKLFLDGKMVTVNTELDFESAEEIALGYDIMCEKEEKVDIIAELLKEDKEDESLMERRPPVVCVMGHVDHGKTSLLDAIRETNVISGEAGGITQHIGASVVKVKDRAITFLDTPGHEAFTSMRMRGAKSTDIAILVVAADDGVMPQTIEAINHAKAAGIEIIVAINKIDKPGANVEKVKQELSEQGLVASDWGGNVEMVPVSAHTKEGINDLLEMVLLQADILELKANPNRQARGIVIEAKLDKGKGSVATVLVQKGTLKTGANIAAGANYGKVRAMIDDRGNTIKTAGPSTPVEIWGLNGTPDAGDVFVSTKTSSEAKEFANTFIEDSKAKLMESNRFRISLDDLNAQIEAGSLKELNIIIKADVQGSVEAIRESLEKLSNEEVQVKVIHGGVGNINESDVILASASNAIIIGFNVKPDSQAEETAKRENVDLRLYSVIYNAIDDIENAMKGMLAPIYEEKVTGHVEVRQIFKASGVGNIAGSYVLDGTVQRGCKVRITRGDKQIFEGNLASLKRFKDDVKEVRSGYECGLVFENFNDIAEGDQVEAYIMQEVKR